MLIGMGTVFLFLTLLVFATLVMSAIAGRLQPAPAHTPQGTSPGEAAGHTDGEIVAAITVAIARHRAAGAGGSTPAARRSQSNAHPNT